MTKYVHCGYESARSPARRRRDLASVVLRSATPFTVLDEFVNRQRPKTPRSSAVPAEHTKGASTVQDYYLILAFAALSLQHRDLGNTVETGTC